MFVVITPGLMGVPRLSNPPLERALKSAENQGLQKPCRSIPS